MTEYFYLVQKWDAPDHKLVGNYINRRELHIEPDWLLIYKLIPENNSIIFERTGTHSDLFR